MDHNHTEEDHTEGGENSLGRSGNRGPSLGIQRLYDTMAVQFNLAVLVIQLPAIGRLGRLGGCWLDEGVKDR